MDAPPVQYFKTRDGYDIACAETGAGVPFVLLPAAFSHIRYDWHMAANQPLLWPLAQRYRLVRFDVRGHGMSTRGLPDSLRMDDFLLDLEAVLDGLALDQVVLFGWYAYWRVAVSYAARNPERVAGLVLYNPEEPIDPTQGEHPFMSLARDAWDLFLSTLVTPYAPAHGASYQVEDMKASRNQDDFLRLLRAICACDMAPVLPAVETPTLIVAERFPQSVATFIDSAQRIAAGIRNSRLITFDAIGDAFAAEQEEASPFIRAVEDFVDHLPMFTPLHPPLAPPMPAPPASLSARQLEVLCLIAAGRTNRQIADALVLSERTVERHVADVYDKTGAANRAQAAIYAKDHGLV